MGLARIRSETDTLAQNIVGRQLWFAAVPESYDAGMHERKLTRQTGVTDHVREYQPRGERRISEFLMSNSVFLKGWRVLHVIVKLSHCAIVRRRIKDLRLWQASRRQSVQKSRSQMIPRTLLQVGFACMCGFDIRRFTEAGI